MRRIVPVLLLLCAVFLLLSGCGMSADGRQTISNDVLRLRYDAGEWVAGGEGDSMSFLRMKGGLPTAVSVRLHDRSSAPLSGKDEQRLAREMEEWLPGYLTVEDSFVTATPDGKCFVVLETVSAFTEEYIDHMLAIGAYTEEMIAQMGGRETMLSYGPIRQMMLFAEIQGALFVFSYEPGMESAVNEIFALINSAERVWKVPLRCSWD